MANKVSNGDCRNMQQAHRVRDLSDGAINSIVLCDCEQHRNNHQPCNVAEMYQVCVINKAGTKRDKLPENPEAYQGRQTKG